MKGEIKKPEQAKLFIEEVVYIEPPCRCNDHPFPHYHPGNKRKSDVYSFPR